MVLRQSDAWKEETFQSGDNRFVFTNKGNFFVDVSVNGETALNFQLPRVDIDKRQFFSLIAGVYTKIFDKGIEAGRREFAENLRYLVEYGG